MKLAKFLFSLFFICTTAISIAENVDFKILSSIPKEVKGGATLNVMVIFSNTGNYQRLVSLKLIGESESWKFVSDFSSLVLPKQSTIRKIVGIYVPQYQKAGEVPVKLVVFDNNSASELSSACFVLSIQPRYGIALEKLKAPTQMFAGDTSSFVYLIRNTSNIDVSVKLRLSDGLDTKVELINLRRDSARVFSYPIRIPKNTDNFSQRSIFVNAEIQDIPEKGASLHAGIEIFKIGKEKFDPYNRFNVQIGAVGAMTTAFGNTLYSGMYDVAGRGLLGKPEKRQQLEFRMRGPNRNGNPLFGLNDEYFAKYSSKNLEITLGDYGYGLSDLTESSRNGLGVGVVYTLNKLSFGGYYTSPKYYPLIRSVYSGFARLNLNENNKFQIGYLSKIDTTVKQTQLVSLTAKNRLFPWLSTNMEISLGTSEKILYKAYKGGLTINTKKVGGSVDYTYADKGFPGFISNAQRMYSVLSINLNPIYLSVNYNKNSSTQALDTLFAKPPITESLGATAGVRFLKHFSINLGGIMSSTKENAPDPLFNYKRYNARVSMQAQYKKISVNLQGDAGKLENYLLNTGTSLTNFFTGSANTYFSIFDNLSINGSVSYQTGQKGITGSETAYYGFGINGSLTERYTLSLNYNSNFEWEYYTSDRNLFSLNLSALINEYNKLSLTTNYNLIKNSLDNKTFSAQLRYAHTLRIPISKRKDVGSLEGRIINKGVESVSAIRLSVGGRIAVTDKDGNFKFLGLPVGNHPVVVDASSFGLHTIAETPGPYIVVIKPAQTTFFEFAMTKSARIEGAFEIEEDQRANQKGFIKVAERLDRLIIEASSGDEVYRVLSDINGGFKFEDLRPGVWSVKVYPNGLPKGYSIINSQFTINLSPKQDERIIVRVEKKARQIQFQKSF